MKYENNWEKFYSKKFSAFTSHTLNAEKKERKKYIYFVVLCYGFYGSS